MAFSDDAALGKVLGFTSEHELPTPETFIGGHFYVSHRLTSLKTADGN